MPAIRNERTSRQLRHDPLGGGGMDSAKGKGKGKGGSKGEGKGKGKGGGKDMPKKAGLGLGGMSLPVQKKHGQHLLKNPGIIDKILKACELTPADTVFEIGPGTGNLTMQLLESSKRVVAHEIDPRMAAEVRKRAMAAGRNNLSVEEIDVLRGKWPVFDVCAANLPYKISSPFTFRLIAHRPLFRCAVLMFQREFADRLIAKCGEKNYGRLALNTRLFVKVSCVCKVSRGSFTPPPDVDSMVVKVVPRDPPIEVDFREWDGLMRICFGRKNKILRAAFATKSVCATLEENYKTWCALKGLKQSKEPIKSLILGILSSLQLAEKRAITIELDTYFRLLLEFNKKGIHFTNAKPGVKIGENVDEKAFPAGIFLDDEVEEGEDGGDSEGGMED